MNDIVILGHLLVAGWRSVSWLTKLAIGFIMLGFFSNLIIGHWRDAVDAFVIVLLFAVILIQSAAINEAKSVLDEIKGNR